MVAVAEETETEVLFELPIPPCNKALDYELRMALFDAWLKWEESHSLKLSISDAKHPSTLLVHCKGKGCSWIKLDLEADLITTISEHAATQAACIHNA